VDTLAIGRLIGIARRDTVRAPMEELEEGVIAKDGGLERDHKGRKFPLRGITVLSQEAWKAALSELEGASGPVSLPWTTRRANLFVAGLILPRARGGVVRTGPVVLEVTYPTQPCARMDEANPGLLKALHPDWRGGITTRVVEGGLVRLGDRVEVLHAPPEQTLRLPG
jgi:MOSC domain-containing protein YiiM